MVKGREVVAIEPQLQEMETEKGRRWGAAVSEGKRGRRRGDSTVSEVDDTTKNGMVAEEAKDGGWCLDVKDGQRKMGR
jgi:hypothetical protein